MALHVLSHFVHAVFKAHSRKGGSSAVTWLQCEALERTLSNDFCVAL